MPQPIENVSSDLINMLKDRFEIADSVDEAGHFTDDPAEIKVFSFNFINKKGEDKGSVVMSLLDDSESNNSIKIYFGQDLGNSDTETRKEWYAFLKDIRQFAKMHLLGFDVRNINKSQITRRDVEKDLKLVTEDIIPMFEGSFGPIDGTVKTSQQRLQDSNIRIVIKHSDRVDPNVKYGRSRKIEKIYLVNGNGERFLLPFPSLLFARAMARHIEAGGTPYDNVGGSMCQLMDEMKVLSRFIRFVRSHIPQDDAKKQEAIEAGRERYREIKKQLSRLTSKDGYKKFHDSVPVDEPIIDNEIQEDIFDNVELDEENRDALPYIYRAYDKFKKVPEEGEFEKWVNAAKGQGEGQDVIMDGGVEEEESKVKCPACYSNIVIPDGVGNFKCAECRYKWNENDTGHGYDETKEHPDDFYEDKSQIMKGKKAAQRDLEMLRQQKEDSEDYRPFEYGGMNGSIPTSDEIVGMGQMTYESEMSRLKKIVESASKPSCPHCGSKKYSLMPTDFETAKCKDCGKNWDHGIVKGINDPYEVNESAPDRWGNTEPYTPCEEYGHRFQLEGDPEIYSTCLDCGAPNLDHDEDHDWRAGHEPEKVTEAIVSEFFGIRSRASKTNQDITIMEKLLTDLGFDCIVKRPDNQIWKKSYFSVIFGPAENKKLGWVITRNGQFKDKGFGSRSFFEAFFINNPEFHGELHRLSGKNNEKVVESALNELFGFRNKKKELTPEEVEANAKAHYDDMLSLLKFFGFEMIAKKNDLTIWQNSYYKVLVEPQVRVDGEHEINWTINRNGRNTYGEGAVEFCHTIMKDEEFRGHKDTFMKRLAAGENPVAVTESAWANKLARWVQSTKVQPAFELNVIQKKQPKLYSELVKLRSGRAARELIVAKKEEIANAINSLNEADVPSSSGWSGPLTWVNTQLGAKFRKPSEIAKHENTTGKLSPFSLLSTPERDVDENGKEISRSMPQGVRSIALPNNASGIDSMSQW